MDIDPIASEYRAWRYVPLAIVAVAVAMMIAAFIFTGPRRAVMDPVAPGPDSSLIERMSAMRFVPGAPLYSLDVVETKPGNATIIPGSVTIVKVTRTQSIRLLGWAVDGTTSKPDNAMYLEIDGRSIEPVRYGLKRSDVGAQFGNAALAASGFEAVIPPYRFGPGVHRVDLIMVDAAGTSYHRVIDRVEIHEAK